MTGYILMLAVSLWLREPRRGVRWLGLAALLGVCVQGLLGGLRVNLNAGYRVTDVLVAYAKQAKPVKQEDDAASACLQKSTRGRSPRCFRFRRYRARGWN